MYQAIVAVELTGPPSVRTKTESQEYLQIDDRGEYNREIESRLQQRQSEAEKSSDWPGSVQFGGVIKVLWQCEQPGEKQDRPESKSLPDFNHRDRRHRETRIAQEVDLHAGQRADPEVQEA